MGHHRLTDREKNCIWRSWRKGLTFEAIGGKIGKTGACVFFYLQRYGGIMPRRRKRRPDALTFRERKVIAKGLAWNLSIREIARRLSRSPSTVSREVQRNSWRRAMIRITARKPANGARVGPSPAS